MTEKQMKILSVVAAVNCTLWVAYGLLKKQRDWPVVLANAPGIFLGLITFVTSIMKF